jgi:hypothetical protein
MEILKFSEPPKRSGRSRSSNKSGLMPLVSFGIAVLVLGGMSTTLAGTISLGTNNTVEFGQGIVTTAACDESINVIPSTTFDTSNSTFRVTQIQLTGIGVGTVDTGTAAVAVGCIAKKFTVKAYDATGTLKQFTNAAGGSPMDFLKFKLFENLAGATGGAAAPTAEDSSHGGFAGSGSWKELTNTASAGIVTITNFRLDSSVTKITLETSQ